MITKPLPSTEKSASDRHGTNSLRIDYPRLRALCNACRHSVERSRHRAMYGQSEGVIGRARPSCAPRPAGSCQPSLNAKDKASGDPRDKSPTPPA